MAKIVFIGAGSKEFGNRLVRDILSISALADSSLYLVDTDAARLAATFAYATRLIEHNNLSNKVIKPSSLEHALDGADYVITAISIGDSKPDIEVPFDYAGLRQTVGDTVGVGGIMKGLRTIPTLLDIAKDMEKWCPTALLMNYTNPMAMSMWAIKAQTNIEAIGLCHSIHHTSTQLADYMKVPYEELSYLAAGINHMSWFIDLEYDGHDLHTTLRDCLSDQAVIKKDPIRFQILKYFLYFPSESSRHISEYLPYFHWGIDRDVDIEESFKGSELPTESLTLTLSEEYAAKIITAKEMNVPVMIYGNVPNTHLITNLSQDACVEVPCVVDGEGIKYCSIGELPPQCASLCESNISMQRMFVRGLIEENRDYLYQAAYLDPSTSSQLTLPEIKEVMDLLIPNLRKGHFRY